MTPAPIQAWVLWTRGTYGPEVSVIQNRGNPPWLNAVERDRRLADPIRIEDPDDTMLPLQTIARLYPLQPLTAQKEGGEKT